MEKDIVKGYIRYLKLQRGVSGNTLDAYQHDLRKLLDYLKGEEKDVRDVTLEDLERHRHQCQKPMSHSKWGKEFLPVFTTGRLSR